MITDVTKFLRDAHNCAYEKMEVISNSSQRNTKIGLLDIT